MVLVSVTRKLRSAARGADEGSQGPDSPVLPRGAPCPPSVLFQAAIPEPCEPEPAKLHRPWIRRSDDAVVVAGVGRPR